MAKESYINDLKAQLKRLRDNVNEACKEAHGDCPSCGYEALCGSYLERLEKLLEKAKTCRLDEPIQCSNCKHVGICSYKEAKQHIKNLRNNALLMKCGNENEDCLECPHLSSCSLSHAFYMRQVIKNAGCREPYACRTCTYGVCRFKKGKHVKSLMKRLKEKVCMVNPTTECKDCPKKFYCTYCEAREQARIAHIESLQKKCRDYYGRNCIGCPKLETCELKRAQIARKCIQEHCCDEPYACKDCNRRDCEFLWKYFEFTDKAKKAKSKI